MAGPGVGVWHNWQLVDMSSSGVLAVVGCRGIHRQWVSEEDPTTVKVATAFNSSICRVRELRGGVSLDAPIV